MDSSSTFRSTYQCYPYLTKEEFAEVCHHIHNKYCQATLGPVRKEWRLDVHTALDMSSGHGPGPVTFLQVIRPLDDGTVNQDLASLFDNVGLDEKQAPGADRMMMDLENSDQVRRFIVYPSEWDPDSQTQEVLPRKPRPRFQYGHVTYEIHLHPTYRAPCLWFSLHNLPLEESALDIETVFRRLVPGQFKDALRGTGPIGGISIDHHPVTGLPSFFVHPCLLGDAMAGFDCPKEDYLMRWLGMVGGCVGLWIPKEMAMVQQG